MNAPMRILTSLAEAGKGKPMEIRLDDILPDPANPRSADDESTPAAIEAQDELNGDVKERGVKTPISVRPHQEIKGKFIINYGHRRYQAARANGLATIPAFVDERFDSYDQINENELRTGLTTRARALFIKSRLDAGDSKGDIAARMRKKNQNFITEHLALIDAPDCVNLAYASGVTGARALYDLRQAWEQFPDQIDDWARSGVRIGRDTIKEALNKFRLDEKEVPPIAPETSAPPTVPEFRLDEKRPVDTAPKTSPDREFRLDEKNGQPPAQPRAPLASPKPPARTREIIVQYKGKPARIAASTTVRISLDGVDAELEVPLAELVFKP